LQDYLLSLLLGIVEGLTEFLPVSSTAHLRITEALLHIHLDDPFWKMYSIVIQLGAILCLPIYFRGRIARFLSTFPRGERGDRTALTHPLSLVMIAFVCTAVPSLLLTKLIGKHLESLTVMGISLLVGGVIMWIVDAYFGSPRSTGRHILLPFLFFIQNKKNNQARQNASLEKFLLLKMLSKRNLLRLPEATSILYCLLFWQFFCRLLPFFSNRKSPQCSGST
jgi:undecaprenyl pyrophosphate phosphatase UppP